MESSACFHKRIPFRGCLHLPEPAGSHLAERQMSKKRRTPSHDRPPTGPTARGRIKFTPVLRSSGEEAGEGSEHTPTTPTAGPMSEFAEWSPVKVGAPLRSLHRRPVRSRGMGLTEQVKPRLRPSSRRVLADAGEGVEAGHATRFAAPCSARLDTLYPQALRAMTMKMVLPFRFCVAAARYARPPACHP